MYEDIKRGQRNGSVPRAKGPCEIKGCMGCPCGKANCAVGRSAFAYDHCHIHGYVRGIVCISCNNKLKRFDGIMATGRLEVLPFRLWRAPVSAYIEHWNRCPECVLTVDFGTVLRVLDMAQAKNMRNYRRGLGSRYRVRDAIRRKRRQWRLRHHSPGRP